MLTFDREFVEESPDVGTRSELLPLGAGGNAGDGVRNRRPKTATRLRETLMSKCYLGRRDRPPRSKSGPRERASEPAGKARNRRENAGEQPKPNTPTPQPLGEAHIVENKWSAKKGSLLSHDVIHNTWVTPEAAESCLLFSI